MGEGNKEQGRDGIGSEFFKVTWGAMKDDMLDLFTRMFANNNVLEQQKRGVIVCIPKIARPYHPTDFQPITLLKAYYEILVRNTSGQIRPALE